jgi:endonuclease YncB( thermonuclease family)
MHLALLFVLLSPSLAEIRTSTDDTGARTHRAELLEAHGGVAYLKENGKVTPVPIAKLSEADRRYIQTANPVQTLSGLVVSVANGDTFNLLDAEKKLHRIRLEGIDAPESRQEFGAKSTKALADKILAKQVTVEWKQSDHSGQILGHLIVDDRWVNQEQIAEGLAWHYKEFNKSSILAAAEADARQRKLGLWADKEPIPPWDFRKQFAVLKPPPAALAASPSAKSRTAKASATEVMVYVTTNGRKYHREDCQYLTKGKHAIPLSEAVKRYEPCSKCHPPTQ